MRYLLSLVFVLLVCLLVTSGCQPRSRVVKGPLLTAADIHLCDSLQLDSSVFSLVRAQTDSVLQSFPADLELFLGKELDVDSSFQPIAGFVFHAASFNSTQILNSVYNELRGKGYTIFLMERNYGIGSRSDVLAVLHTVDKYRILKQVQTDGINWDIDNDSLQSIIRRFDKAYSLDLVGAGLDWCEFTIRQPPTDWLKLANEAYAVCPDIVDQGTGTVERLAEEMKQGRQLYFWWD